MTPCIACGTDTSETLAHPYARSGSVPLCEGCRSRGGRLEPGVDCAVHGCWDCPMRAVWHRDTHGQTNDKCAHPAIPVREFTDEEQATLMMPPPHWCPLRTASVVVRLVASKETP